MLHEGPLDYSSKVQRGKFVVYDLRQHHIDTLRYRLGVHDWSQLLSSHKLQMIYDEFFKVVEFYITLRIPVKMMRPGRQGPDCITPYVKSLLAKRNKLRRRCSI